MSADKEIQAHLASAMPFLSARLNRTVEDLCTLTLPAIAELFGEESIRFIAEIAATPARSESLTAAEIMAYPAIRRAFAMVRDGASSNG